MRNDSVSCSGNRSLRANHVAIAASYAALVANASAASARRVSSDTSPCSRSSRSTISYCRGSVTAATWAKFLAAARSIDGPPTSIISIVSSSVGPMPGGERGERIEVHADDVERRDPVLGELLFVILAIPLGEDAGVDRRVQRLDAAAEHLRGTGHVLDLRDGQPVLGEECRGAARRDELEPELGEAAREVVDAFLLVDGDQGAGHSSLTMRGSSRCSTAWMRSSSVALGSSGTRSCASTGPVSSPSST